MREREKKREGMKGRGGKKDREKEKKEGKKESEEEGKGEGKVQTAKVQKVKSIFLRLSHFSLSLFLLSLLSVLEGRKLKGLGKNERRREKEKIKRRKKRKN